MILRRPAKLTSLLVSLATAAGLASGQNAPKSAQELPAELRRARVYHLPEKNGARPLDNPAIYKRIVYRDINLERLLLDVYVAIKPVDRPATIRKIVFLDVRVAGVPMRVETFSQEFKLGKMDPVDLPAPLACSLVFSDLDSLDLLKAFMGQQKVRITGESFIEVKLNALEKLALRTRQLVLPVPLNEEVPMELFSASPLVTMAAGKVVNTLLDPATLAALNISRERVERIREQRTLSALAWPAVFLLYSEYTLRDPASGAEEKFSQSGTGVMVSADGKLLSSKGVIQPWKFDPETQLLIAKHGLKLDPSKYRVWAWQAGSNVLNAEGEPDFGQAFGTERQTLRVLATSSDRPEKREYRDPDSGEAGTIELEPAGPNEAAVLQLAGKSFEPLVLASPAHEISPRETLVLVSYPYGLSQLKAEPKLDFVTVNGHGKTLALGRILNAGETGAPLLSSDGKILALAGGADECISLDEVRRLLP